MEVRSKPHVVHIAKKRVKQVKYFYKFEISVVNISLLFYQNNVVTPLHVKTFLNVIL